MGMGFKFQVGMGMKSLKSGEEWGKLVRKIYSRTFLHATFTHD